MDLAGTVGDERLQIRTVERGEPHRDVEWWCIPRLATFNAHRDISGRAADAGNAAREVDIVRHRTGKVVVYEH